MKNWQCKRLKGICLTIILITVPILGTGCWDVQDVSNQAFVSALGMDLAEGPDRGKFAVTFEIIHPSGLKSEQGTTPTLVYTISADSVPKAINLLQTRLSRSITMTHLRTVIIGENLARRQNFTDLSSYFETNSKIALRLRLAFVQGGKASDILMTRPLFARNVAQEYVDMSQLDGELSQVPTNPLYHFLSDLRSTNGTACGERVLPVPGGKMIIRHGGVIFDRWKLVGWLSGEETQAANWITGGARAGAEFKTPEGLYTYQTDKINSRIKPIWKNDRLAFKVLIKTDGSLTSEIGKDLALTKPDKLKKLEKELALEITRQASSAIAKSQLYFGVDYLGFGKALKRYEPDIYKKLQWEAVFPNVPIEIEVKSSIDRFGMAR